MGKKPQKTKEIWAAIAEASSATDENQEQPQPTRKRGRPRKIVVKMESSEEKAASQQQEEEGSMKKEEGTKTSSEVEACMVRKEEVGEEIQLVPKGVSVSCRSSRARRKSKPIKSSTQ